MTNQPDAPTADDPAAPAAAGWRPLAGWRPGPRAERALRIAGAAVVALVTLEAAVIECFLVPFRIGTVPLPLATVLAVAGNLVFPRMMVTVARRRATGVVPPVLWLIVVLLFSAPRGEGDLVVPGTWPALLFLFVGSIVGAYGAATAVLGGTPRRLLPRSGAPAGRPWPAVPGPAAPTRAGADQDAKPAGPGAKPARPGGKAAEAGRKAERGTNSPEADGKVTDRERVDRNSAGAKKSSSRRVSG